MKATESTESFVARVLGKHVGLDFGSARQRLGEWGQVDRCVELKKDNWVVLEVEGKQHHPNTNVLKLWPFLEREKALSVVLLHAFLDSATCRTSTRGQLAAWLARRMESQLQNRFRYHSLIVHASGRIEGPTATRLRGAFKRGSDT